MPNITSASRASQKASPSPTQRGRRRRRHVAENGASHPFAHLQGTIGNRAVGRMIQAKMHVSQPGDQLEKEADQTADRVMRMPEPNVQQQPEEKKELRRQPAEEKEDNEKLQKKAEPPEPDDELQRAAAPAEEEKKLQAQSDGGQASTVSPQAQARLNHLRGNGRPLPESVRASFEPRFGYDFSHVRVHNDGQAADLAKSLKARAFTVGHDIAFGSGEYAPESATGQKLLAHELTHVIQQNGETATLRNKGLDIQKTSQPVIQRGFFGDIWEGAKKVGGAIGKGAKAVGDAIVKGAKAVGGAIVKGAKAVGGAIVKGAKAVGKWGWNVLKSGGAWVWNLFTKAPLRLWRIIEHLGSGAVGVVKWLWNGIKTVRGLKSFAQWIWSGFVSGAAWVGRLLAKLLDVVGIGELLDLIWQIIKFNTRTLSSAEIAEAKKVFGNSLSYWQVRIDEYSLIAWLGSLFRGGGGLGVTTFHTINFNQKIKTAPGNSDMAWLIHELTHVSQYEHVGSQYLGEAIHAQATKGYGYGGEAGLLADRAAGKHFRDYNREQQGDIARDFYLALTSGRSTAAYDPFIAELRAGKL